MTVSCHKSGVKTEFLNDNVNYDKAWYFYDKQITDSSFIYFNNAKEEFLAQGDSVTAAKCLINMAIISGDKGDYFGSQEISLSAIKYLNAGSEVQREVLSSNYNNLGKIAHLLKKYNEADSFYRKSLDLSNNEDSKILYINNIAINLSADKKYNESLKYFDKLLKNKGVQQNPINYSRVLSNISKTKWLRNPKYIATNDLLKSLYIRESVNDLWGQNASYSHLTDYYTIEKPDSAFFYAQKMYGVAQKIKSPDDQHEALEKLIKLSPIQETKYYFQLYKKLDDSIITARNAAKNQFALIRYETEKNKADNLVLQKDNAVKRYQIIILISGMLLITFISIFWYKKRKLRLKLEAESSIRESQLKTSKKVHDVVANGLYRVMTEIENQEFLNKDHVLDKIEDLYEKSRDISYDKPEPVYNHFHEKISALLLAFATEQTLIAIAGNTAELWDKISPKGKYEIEHILQELMVNMKKHSGANKVAVKFEESHNQCFIHYIDNGVGMQKNQQFNNGLTNTGNRINSIDGAITFDTKIEKGLKIQISFPIS